MTHASTIMGAIRAEMCNFEWTWMNARCNFHALDDWCVMHIMMHENLNEIWYVANEHLEKVFVPSVATKSKYTGSKVLQWTYKAIHSHSKIASPKWCAMFCHKILTFVSWRLDGPPDHDYGLVEKFRRCTVSTDLKTAGLWTEGSLQSCVNLVTGAARNQGLCTGLYINYAAGKGCECTQDYCKDRTGDQEFSI